MPMPWIYNPNTHNYRDTTTGRLIKAKDIVRISGENLDRTLPIAKQLAHLLVTDQLKLQDWELLMREEIKSLYIQQYLLGKGGVENMTPADWGSIGGMLRVQYQYLNAFAHDIKSGNLTEAQIAYRAQLYFNSARQAFSKAYARARDWDELPAHPGDGTTICLTNCRCHWEKVGSKTYRWVLDFEAEHCTSPGTDRYGRPTGCLERGALWNPYAVT